MTAKRSVRWLALATALGLTVYTTAAVLARSATGNPRWVAIGGGALVLAAGSVLAPRTHGRAGLLLVLAGGAVFRLVLVPNAPILSDDLYRYLWDGKVSAAGISPYAYAPDAPELAALRDSAIWPRINRRGSPTIYPPVTQRAFAVSWLAGVRTPSAWKTLAVTLDVAAMALLALALARSGRDPTRVVSYAWNPVPILAFGDSGHADVLVVLALAGAVLAWQSDRLRPLAVLLGLAVAAKLYPLVALPAFARGSSGPWSTRRALALGAIAAAVVLVAYLPYLLAGDPVLGFLTEGYLREESYASGRRFLLFARLGLDGRLYAGPVLALVAVAALRSRRPAPVRAAWLLGAVIVLTLHYPWYAAPLVAMAAAGGAGWAWPWLAVALEAAYIGLIQPLAPLPDGRSIRLAAGVAIVALVLAAARSPRARRAVVFQAPP